MFVRPIFANIFSTLLEAHSASLPALHVCSMLGTYQKLAGGKGGGKQGGHSFLSPSKGRVMKKMTGKEGGSREIKPS